MGLRRNRVAGMEGAGGDDARRESGNGGAGTYSDAAGNLTGAGIGHGGSAQDGEILSRSERLRVSVGCESRQRGEEEEKAPGEPKAK